MPEDKNKKPEMANENEESILARIIGFGLIVLAVIFIILTLTVLFLSRREATVDSSLRVPQIEAPEYSNEKSFEVTGTTDGKGTVIVYLNDEILSDGVEANSDGEFEYEITVDEDGEYSVTAATVDGFPLKKRSEKAEPVTVVVDTQAPSADDSDVKFERQADGKFRVYGTTEPNGVVTLDNGEDQFNATADDEGKFEMKDVDTANGTDFKVTISDRAGNTVRLSEEVELNRPNDEAPKPAEDDDENADSNNGNGAVNGAENGPALPEASGELEAALSTLLSQNAMVFFAVVALAIFAVNMGVVSVKVRK